MAAMDTTQLNSQLGGSNGLGGYDPKTLKNYAAMSAMYWPGFDSAAGYAAAAYSQASALAAAATNLGQTVNNGNNITSSVATTNTASLPLQNGTIAPSNPMQTIVGSNPAMSPVNTGIPGSGLSANGAISFPAHSTTSSSPKKKPQPVPDEQKDGQYWERRKRNNESARRSRESRRMKEEQIALRVVYLEQENLQLRTEVSMLRAEIEKMRMLLYNTATHH